MAKKQKQLIIQIGREQSHLISLECGRAEVDVTSTQAVAMCAECMPRSKSDVSSLLASLDEVLSTYSQSQGPSTLIFPASWCFFQRIPMHAPRWTLEAAAFEFEKYVPVALEHLTYVAERNDSESAIVIALYTEPLRAIIDAVEKYGLHVERVLPDIQAACLTWNTKEDCAHPLVLSSGAHAAAVLRTPEGKISDISSSYSAHGACTSAWLASWTDRFTRLGINADRWLVIDLSLDEASAAEPATNDTAIEICASGSDAVRQMAVAVTSARNAPNLCIGTLASSRRFARLQRAAVHSLIAVFAFCCVSALSHRWEATRCRAAAANVVPIRASLFERAFPGSKPDAAAALRVQSELVKLRGLTSNLKRDSQQIPVFGLQLVERLSRAIAQFPSETKVLLTEAAVENDDLRFSGMSTAHDAAGDLVRALGELSNLEVDAPRSTLRKDGTVEFQIHARERSPSHGSK